MQFRERQHVLLGSACAQRCVLNLGAARWDCGCCLVWPVWLWLWELEALFWQSFCRHKRIRSDVLQHCGGPPNRLASQGRLLILMAVVADVLMGAAPCLSHATCHGEADH